MEHFCGAQNVVDHVAQFFQHSAVTLLQGAQIGNADQLWAEKYYKLATVYKVQQ